MYIFRIVPRPSFVRRVGKQKECTFDGNCLSYLYPTYKSFAPNIHYIQAMIACVWDILWQRAVPPEECVWTRKRSGMRDGWAASRQRRRATCGGGGQKHFMSYLHIMNMFIDRRSFFPSKYTIRVLIA